MPLVRGGKTFPGHVVMEGLRAALAKEVRKEICGNNTHHHLKITCEPAEPPLQFFKTAGIS